MHAFPNDISKMQTASSKIWSQVADPISYDENHYAKCTPMKSHTIIYSI